MEVIISNTSVPYASTITFILEFLFCRHVLLDRNESPTGKLTHADMFYRRVSRSDTIVWGLLRAQEDVSDSFSMWSFFSCKSISCNNLSIYIPWPFPPVWGVAGNTKEQRKQWGFYSVLLAMTRDLAEFGWHCWRNTAHPPPSSTTYVTS